MESRMMVILTIMMSLAKYPLFLKNKNKQDTLRSVP
jgi:hypothetical protein